jgi:hypothetical protein
MARRSARYLGIQRFGIGRRCGFFIPVIIVLGLTAHCERAGHRRFDLTIGIGPQHLQIPQFDRLLAPNRADNARHRNRPPISVDHGARVLDVDAIECRGKTIGIAFPPLFAIGDDIKPGALLIADRQNRGVVLRRFELVRRDEPEIVDAHARHLLGQLVAID